MRMKHFFRKFYSVKKNSEELKIKSVDEADSGYFAVEFLGQWHRVEPYDTPMGAAIRVIISFRLNLKQFNTSFLQST